MSTDSRMLHRILTACRTIAVVGLPAEWRRPSDFSATYMP
jgi:predicted CoA-binding protein